MSLTPPEIEFIRHAAERLDVRNSTKLFNCYKETATDKKLVHELYKIAENYNLKTNNDKQLMSKDKKSSHCDIGE
jgi:hypothetical protein